MAGISLSGFGPSSTLSAYLAGGAGGVAAARNAGGVGDQPATSTSGSGSGTGSGTAGSATTGPAVGAVKTAVGKPTGGSATGTLSDQDQQLIDNLKKRDALVRAHEQAHRTTGGQFAGTPSFTYQKGPDGTNYAIGGEVNIDMSPVDKDPSATIAKMRQVQSAALAPADPSGQDLRVAAQAAQAAAEAASDSGKAATGSTGSSDDKTDKTDKTGKTGKTGEAKGGQGSSAFQAQALGAAAESEADSEPGRGARLLRGLAAYASAARVGAVVQASARAATVVA
jgi:hypothetical protein